MSGSFRKTRSEPAHDVTAVTAHIDADRDLAAAVAHSLVVLEVQMRTTSLCAIAARRRQPTMVFSPPCLRARVLRPDIENVDTRDRAGGDTDKRPWMLAPQLGEGHEIDTKRP